MELTSPSREPMSQVHYRCQLRSPPWRHIFGISTQSTMPSFLGYCGRLCTERVDHRSPPHNRPSRCGTTHLLLLHARESVSKVSESLCSTHHRSPFVELWASNLRGERKSASINPFWESSSVGSVPNLANVWVKCGQIILTHVQHKQRKHGFSNDINHEENSPKSSACKIWFNKNAKRWRIWLSRIQWGGNGWFAKQFDRPRSYLAPMRGGRLGSSTFFLMGPTRWCPRSIAKLVYNSNNNGFCWWYIDSFHGIINQLITWGAPPCR
jgi:hypothetical protein